MPKSEVLIEMPEFEKKYNLAMVDTEKTTSRVRPKQFLHIDEAEAFYVKGVLIYVLGNAFIIYLLMQLTTQ